MATETTPSVPFFLDSPEGLFALVKRVYEDEKTNAALELLSMFLKTAKAVTASKRVTSTFHSILEEDFRKGPSFDDEADWETKGSRLESKVQQKGPILKDYLQEVKLIGKVFGEEAASLFKNLSEPVSWYNSQLGHLRVLVTFFKRACKEDSTGRDPKTPRVERDGEGGCAEDSIRGETGIPNEQDGNEKHIGYVGQVGNDVTLPSNHNFPYQTKGHGTAKRRLADSGDENHVSGCQESQSRAKRVCQTPNAGVESVSNSTPNLPCDGKNTIEVFTHEEIGTTTGTLSLSSTDNGFVEDQNGYGSNSDLLIEEPAQHFQPQGIILGEALSTELIKASSQKVEFHLWNTYHGLSFLVDAFGSGYRPYHVGDFYRHYNVPTGNPEFLRKLAVHMPKLTGWVAEIGEKGEAAKLERITVLLPKDVRVLADSLLVIAAPYC
jgi:hypothetical protein